MRVPEQDDADALEGQVDGLGLLLGEGEGAVGKQGLGEAEDHAGHLFDDGGYRGGSTHCQTR